MNHNYNDFDIENESYLLYSTFHLDDRCNAIGHCSPLNQRPTNRDMQQVHLQLRGRYCGMCNNYAWYVQFYVIKSRTVCQVLKLLRYITTKIRFDCKFKY